MARFKFVPPSEGIIFIGGPPSQSGGILCADGSRRINHYCEAPACELTFERTMNMKLVKDIVTDTSIWPRISDDNAPTPEDWQPVEHADIWYLLVREGEKLLGLFIFTPENSVSWQIHLCLLPCAYGEKTRIALREVTKWIFQNTHCLRITGSIPMHNRLAMKFANDSGWKRYGINPDSYLKNGKLHDQILFGISRSEASWA